MEEAEAQLAREVSNSRASTCPQHTRQIVPVVWGAGCGVVGLGF